MRLLLAEDSARLQELLCEMIRDAGYGLDVVGTSSELIAAASEVRYDVIIVDLGLPDGDGIDAIRSMRVGGNMSPILIMTARETVRDRIRGLDSGADDYLTKPFNNGELLARIRALLRRPWMVTGPLLRTGPLELDEATGETRICGRTLELRTSERRLLALLMRRFDSIVSKAVIEVALSEFGREKSSNAIEILISRLRKAIASAAPGYVQIETIRDVGYALRLNSEA